MHQLIVGESTLLNSSPSSSLYVQPQLLQIHLFPANLTIAIHFTLASHKQISTNFNAFKIHWHVSLQILQNINTSHQHSKKLHWLPIKRRIDYKICLLTNKTLTHQPPTYLYNSLFIGTCYYKYVLQHIKIPNFYHLIPLIRFFHLPRLQR